MTKSSRIVHAIVALVFPFLIGSVPVEAGDFPAHYIVLEMDADGIVEPVFYQSVQLSGLPLSKSEDELRAVRERDPLAEKYLTLRVEDSTGRVLFRDVVSLPGWVRGEFHGRPRDDGGWEIDGSRFPLSRRAFVVRIPDDGGARLIVDGLLQTAFDLEQLSRESADLPLSRMGMIERTVSTQRVGDPANRVDLLIMGDGYRSDQATVFAADTLSLASAFFGITPYSDYSDHVNVTTLFNASTESGTDHPPFNPACVGDDQSCCADPEASTDPLAGTYVSTIFGGRYCAFNIHRLAVVNNSIVLAAAAAVPNWDVIMMLLNDATYGGSGGSIPVTSLHVSAVDIARHEYGHSFTDLADEYDSAFPGFPACSDITSPPCEANVTDETNSGLIKWSPWIAPSTPIPTPEGGGFANDVGLFEGARYLATGMYRPRDISCLMHFLGFPFGEICAQEYVLTLYRGGWGVPTLGIDPIEPGTESPTPSTVVTSACGQVFSVSLLEPASGPTMIANWLVDGVPVAGGNSFTFVPSQPGTYPLELQVEDGTSLVHPAMAGTLLQSSRQWTVVTDTTFDCTTLTVDPGQLAWTTLSGAVSYDVVRGDLGALRSSGGNFSTATAECLADNHLTTDLGYTAEPVAGQGFWILVRGVSSECGLRYDCFTVGQTGTRDDGINGAVTTCP